MIQGLVHAVRRLVGTQRAIEEIEAHANQRADDLLSHCDRLVAEMEARMNGRLVAIHGDLSQQIGFLENPHDLAEQSDEEPLSISEDVNALRPADLRMFAESMRPTRSMEETDLECLDELESLGRKGLFVIGNARSGTTILQRCLNVSKEIFMLDESNLYVNHSNPEFAAWFNRQHAEWKNIAAKGTFAPEPPIPLQGGLAYLAWMARHYRYVGEKYAFGPSLLPEGPYQQDAFWEFQQRFFFRSTYFIIARTPVESVWSMHKMFPEASIEFLIETWLRSLHLVVDLYAAFPNCYMIFLENLDANVIRRVSEILDTEIPVPPSMISTGLQNSQLAADQLPDMLAPYADTLAECSFYYYALKNKFSPETLLIEDVSGGMSFQLTSFRVELREIIDRSALATAEAERKAAG